MRQPDPLGPVTILGAGIVGICTALSLLERGIPVTLVDRGEPGQETSMGNAGVVSPWSIIPQSLPGTWKSIPKLLFGHGRPLSIHPSLMPKMVPWGLRFLAQGREQSVRDTSEAMSHLCAPSIELYQKHLKGTGSEGLITESYYIHASRDGRRVRLEDLEYRIRAQAGADMERVGRSGLVALEPALSPDFETAIVIKGQARIRSPGRLGKVLAQKAQSLGAEIKRADIKRVRRSHAGWTIECRSETLRAERLVICLGAWSADMLSDLPVTLPLMAERGYHAEFADPGVELSHSVMDVDAKVVASSMEDGLRVAGQAEFAPIEAPPSEARKRRLVKVATDLLPDLRSETRRLWMGRRPSFPDSLPMIGPVQRQLGLYLNFGHSHYGLMMAPKSGEFLGQLICGDHINTDLQPYAPGRFSKALADHP